MKISTTSAVALAILWELEPVLKNLPACWTLKVTDAPHGCLDYFHQTLAPGVLHQVTLTEEGRQTPERFRAYLMELAARGLQLRENRGIIPTSGVKT